MKKVIQFLLFFIITNCTILDVNATASYCDKKDCETFEGVGNCAECDGRWHKKAYCNALAIVKEELAEQKGNCAELTVVIKETNEHASDSNWPVRIGFLLVGIALGALGNRVLKRK